MGDFFEFYRNGGLVMHFITITGATGVVALVRHFLAKRGGDNRLERLRLAERLAWIGVGIGLLGSGFGMMELGVALQQVPESDIGALFKMAARGWSIVAITSCYGLMWGLPLLATAAVQRARAGESVLGSPA